MIFFIFVNVSQNNDSSVDRKAKESAKAEQSKKIASLYPDKKPLKGN